MGIPGRVPPPYRGTLPGILAIDLPTRRVGRSIAPTDLFWGYPRRGLWVGIGSRAPGAKEGAPGPGDLFLRSACRPH